MDLIKALYIDPGTGGMLFTIVFGLFGVVIFAFRALIVRFKFFSGGGKNTKVDRKKIPIVVFSDHKRYWNTFKPILDEFESREQKVLFLTCSEDDPALSEKYTYVTCEFLGEGNKAFSRLNMLNATLLLSTTPSLDVFQWKRSKNVDCYIHIPHMPNDITLYRWFGTDHYDALILSGEYQEQQIRKLEELREIKPRDLELCGIPYMDEMKKRLENSGVQKSEGRTVLLAPSWGESGLLSRYGSKLIDALISTGYEIIIRPHPQSFASEKAMLDDLVDKYKDNSAVSWNSDNDNFEVLSKSDILISDFSGVLFDFSLVFDKPVIYTKAKFDVRPYDAFWIEEPLWTFEILPSLGLELTEENVGDIKALIDKCIDDPSFGEGRERARKETWVHMGEGTVRSVDFVMKKYNETVKNRRAKNNSSGNTSKKSRSSLKKEGAAK